MSVNLSRSRQRAWTGEHQGAPPSRRSGAPAMTPTAWPSAGSSVRTASVCVGRRGHPERVTTANVVSDIAKRSARAALWTTAMK